MIEPLKLFKLLADDTRLKILLLLTQNSQLCVCHLTDALQLSQPKVSRHLAMLRQAQLVQDAQHGKWRYYQLAPDLAEWVVTLLQQALLSQPNYLSKCNQRLTNSLTTCETPS
ncbi:metalloregulator ArsR/SmtB family transcription factor [Celerinatantimonas diazotrophica]|uniref:ArsR family transcriptional regulator n=1 Tax=Celerinatantimonas diazotrophica TaxID=412034 RepID=A0A4R1JBB0_9GAMM|nr:metalloregulator ArsR/SmtB family transcription factor [Celerinatantimonas diazotrophica]TCK47429.1 ArsR family transcriptional regulator [Celerinatantimonas diazotrophica]CAG9294953.1 Arsenic resistance transcriptional regulator ArsR1 [Celerinatantimonas diazotrophica]